MIVARTTVSAMSSPQLPKYQAIHATLRRQILDGNLAAGQRLPPQQELADNFGVTLMTLRQAVSVLEQEGLVRVERGNGTFVVDRPVDIRLGNLSSFTQQMRLAGVDVRTEVLGVEVVEPGEAVAASDALGASDRPLVQITRRRIADGSVLSLQRSMLRHGLLSDDVVASLRGESLYDAIEASSGWVVTEAREAITAVAVTSEDAHPLEVEASSPALVSVRTSINQFDEPFLYDEALLVPGRCVLTADRRADRLTLSVGVRGE